MTSLSDKLKSALIALTDSEKEWNKKRYLLAVSAGIDSMVMAHLFLSLHLPFGIVHFNFQLRGSDSEQDENLVTRFGEIHGIPVYIKTEDTRRTAKEMQLSIQETARELRYRFFDETADAFSYDFICTAHHANDQLETLFLHLFRAGGIESLSGIPYRRGRIIRPLLNIPRSEIEAFAEKENIGYREDVSNASDYYLRNRIRHHLVKPLLEWDSIHLKNSLESMSYIRDAVDFIRLEIETFEKKHVVFWPLGIRRLPFKEPERGNPSYIFLLKEYLRSAGLYPDSLWDILSLPRPLVTGKKYEGKNMDVYFDRGYLWIIPESFSVHSGNTKKISVQDSENTQLPVDGLIIPPNKKMPENEITNWSWIPNHNTVTFPLFVRFREPGDKIYSGAVPYFRKELKKLLVEARIPLPLKDNIYIVTDSNHQILCIPGIYNSPKYSSASPDASAAWEFRGPIIEICKKIKTSQE